MRPGSPRKLHTSFDLHRGQYSRINGSPRSGRYVANGTIASEFLILATLGELLVRERGTTCADRQWTEKVTRGAYIFSRFDMFDVESAQQISYVAVRVLRESYAYGRSRGGHATYGHEPRRVCVGRSGSPHAYSAAVAGDRGHPRADVRP
jgi:hypothetical protein